MKVKVDFFNNDFSLFDEREFEYDEFKKWWEFFRRNKDLFADVRLLGVEYDGFYYLYLNSKHRWYSDFRKIQERIAEKKAKKNSPKANENR